MRILDLATARAHALLSPQPEVEERVLAEVLINPEALALATDLEVDDFTFCGRRWTFSAIRNLEAHGETVGLLEVHEAITWLDLTRATQYAQTVTLLWLAELVALSFNYRAAFAAVFPADLRHLRLISNARRAALRAA